MSLPAAMLRRAMSSKGVARWRKLTPVGVVSSPSLCLQGSLGALGFLFGDGFFERADGNGHVCSQQDAFAQAFFAGAPPQSQNLPAIGFQHDDVAGYFGFEFVKHGGARSGFMMPLTANAAPTAY